MNNSQSGKNLYDVVVWIQVYNNEETLEQTLESVLQQKNCSYLIVAHDDASTDGSLQILNTYKSRAPHLIRIVGSSSNSLQKGVFSRKIQAIKPYSSRYVAFLDGDDVWTDPLKLESVLEKMNSNHAVLGFHKVEFINHSGEEQAIHPLSFAFGIHSGKKRLLRLLKVGKFAIPTCSMVVRRDVVDRKMNLPQNNLIGQDLITKVLAADTGRFTYLDVPMAKMRIRSTSLWSPESTLWKIRRTISILSFASRFVRVGSTLSLVWYLASWGIVMPFFWLGYKLPPAQNDSVSY